MALATAVSVASFSAILAETFAAVGLSTVVPAGVVTLARLVKALSTDQQQQQHVDGLMKLLGGTSATAASGGSPATPGTAGTPGAAAVAGLVQAMSASLPSLDLLLPKTAKIHAEFTFEAHEIESGAAGLSTGASISSIVSINAGFSALYENTSTNKITLDVDFVSVNVPL